MNRKDQKNSLMDRHEAIMAQILTRFRNMVRAAAEPVASSSPIPQASLNVMTMQNETAALIKEVENLLLLSREIKALWIAGPLRKPGDEAELARERENDERSDRVAKLYNSLVDIHNANKKRLDEDENVGPESATTTTMTMTENGNGKENGDGIGIGNGDGDGNGSGKDAKQVLVNGSDVKIEPSAAAA